MAKVIVAIHGLRNKPPKNLLEKWGKMAITEGFKKFGLKIKLPAFELVYWADVLYDKPLLPDVKDPESPYFLDEVYKPDPENIMIGDFIIRRKFIRYFKKIIYKIFLKENYQLRYPFLAKSFIHSNFHDLEVYFAENCDHTENKYCENKKEIDKRLIDVLKKYQNDDIFLIAHSMGCIIAYDVLSFVAPELKIHTLATIGSPLGAPFVISRIAKYTKKINHKLKIQTPESVCKNWYNFADVRDNIAMDFKLSDDFEANSKGVKVRDHLVNNTYKMGKTYNPHKSYGYLRTPKFIKALKDFMEED